MGKQADEVNYDHEEGMAFRSSLATDVRSMLADFSKTRKEQTEKAQSERKAFLHTLRNHVTDLSAEARKIISGSVMPTVAIDMKLAETDIPNLGQHREDTHEVTIDVKLPDTDILKVPPVQENLDAGTVDALAEQMEFVVTEAEILVSQTEPPIQETHEEAVVLPEPVIPAPVEPAVTAPVEPSFATPVEPTTSKIKNDVAKPKTLPEEAKHEGMGESSWLRETILGSKPRKSPSRQKRTKK